MVSPAQRLLRNSRREAAMVLLVWLGFLVWVIGCCGLLGYASSPGIGPDSAQPTATAMTGTPLQAGLPSWILWGIVIPWISATLFTAVFAIRILRDDELGLDLEPRHDAGAMN